MNFEIHTQINKREYVEFYQHCMFTKKKKHPILLMYLMVLIFPLAALIGFFTQNTALGTCFLFLSALMLLMTTFLLFVSPRIVWKKISAKAGAPTRMVFDEGSLHVFDESEGMSGESHIAYDKLVNVCETAQAFYLFITPRQAFIVAKRCLVPENVPLLASLLRERIDPKKYTNLM